MNIRKIAPRDKQAILTSFEPLFDDWDYLQFVIDDWFVPSPQIQTWVVYAGPSETLLVALGQAVEVSPGEWYLGALRSNSRASRHKVACAILGLKRVMENELKKRKAVTLLYGTQAKNRKSLRMASIFGFKQYFQVAHAWHRPPEIPNAVQGLEAKAAEAGQELLDYFLQGPGLKPIEGYFQTWWDSRRLEKKHLIEALEQNLLYKVVESNRMIGAAMFWHIPWQNFLVLSIMEGTDKALMALYQAAIAAAHNLKCTAIGMVHPSMKEMHRRQRLFGLQVCGTYAVQLIRRVASQAAPRCGLRDGKESNHD